MESISPTSALNIYFKNGSNSQMTGNYAATPADGIFTVSPGEMEYYKIYAISIDMRLGSTIVVTNYGTGGALSTGITITAIPTFDPDKFEPIVIKTNQDLENHFDKTNKLSDAVFIGENRLYFKTGQPIILKARKEKAPDKLIITSTENLTSRFTAHSFMAHGSWGTL